MCTLLEKTCVLHLWNNYGFNSFLGLPEFAATAVNMASRLQPILIL